MERFVFEDDRFIFEKEKISEEEGPSIWTHMAEGIRTILPFYVPPSGPPIYDEDLNFIGFSTPTGEIETPPDLASQRRWALLELLVPASPTIGKSIGLGMAKAEAKKVVHKGIKEAVPSVTQQFRDFRLIDMAQVTEKAARKGADISPELAHELTKMRVSSPSTLMEERIFKPAIQRPEEGLNKLTKEWNDKFPYLTDIWKERPRTGIPKQPAEMATIQTKEGIKSVRTESRGFSDVIQEINRLRYGGSLGAAKGTEKYAGSINLHRISELTETTQNIIKQYAEKGPRMTWDAAVEWAQKSGVSIRGLKSVWKRGMLNHKQLNALREINVNVVQQLGDFVDALPANPTDEQLAFTQEVLLNYRHSILDFLGEASSEAGRTLAILRRTINPDARLKILLKAGNKEQLQEFITLWKDADFNSLGIDLKDINKLVKGMTEVTTADKVHKLWINFILSSPRTHVRNIVGNTLTLAGKIPEKSLSAFFDSLRVGGAKLIGKEVERERYFKEIVPEIYGILGGLEQSISKAFNWASRGKIPYNPKYRLPIFAQRTKIEDILRQRSKWEIPTHLLDLEDRFFKTIVYASDLNAGAMRRGLKKDLRGKELTEFITDLIHNPTEDLMQEAAEGALFRTFQNPLGEWGRSLSRLRNVPIGPVKPFAYIAPFLRTPINITKYGLKHTPANFMYLIAKGKELPNAQIADELARATMGSMLMLYFTKKAMEGKITGRGPTNPGKRETMMLGGWRPYSFYVGKDDKGQDQFRNYISTEPVSMWMGLAAEYAELRGFMSDRETEDFVSASMKGLSNLLINKTYMQGISNAIKALSEPDRYGQAWYGSLISGFVPNIASDIARARDPVVRQAKYTLDKIRNRIIFEKEKLVPDLNFFGEEKRYEGHPVSMLYNPFYLSTRSNDPVVQEFVNLNITRQIPTNIGSLELEPRQHNEFIKKINNIKLNIDQEPSRSLKLKDMLGYYTSKPNWKNVPLLIRKRIFERTIDRFIYAGSMSYIATLKDPNDRKKAIVPKTKGEQLMDLGITLPFLQRPMGNF